MDHHLKEQPTVICDCTGTTREKINQLVNQGVNTLDEIERLTGACTGCGACDIEVEKLLVNSVFVLYSSGET